MTTPILKVRGLIKEFGKTRVVSGVSFDGEQGQIIGLLGPNGAGKTTTLRMLSGFIPPTQGDISVCGFFLRENPLEAKREIGYLPETVPLYQEMRVREILEFIGRLRGLARGVLASEIERLFEALSLARFSKQLIGRLSKGFRQRVGLACALIGGPKLVLLDEPTSGLDPEQTVEMRSLITKIKQSACVILSTHLLSEVELISDRVLIMKEGTIIASGSPESLRERMDTEQPIRLEDVFLKLVKQEK